MKLSVFGMMNSGTNIADKLIRAGYPDAVLLRQPVWKHAFRAADIEAALSEVDRAVLCVRDPVLVLSSTLARPHALRCRSVREECEIRPKRPEHARAFRDMSEYYNVYTDAYLAVLARFPGCVAVLRYEDVLSDAPAAVQAAVGSPSDRREAMLAAVAAGAKHRMRHLGVREAREKAANADALLAPDDLRFVRERCRTVPSPEKN